MKAKFGIWVLGLLLLGFGACKDEDPKPFKPTVDMVINHDWIDSTLVLNKIYTWEHSFSIDTIKPTTLIYHINNIRLLTQDSLMIDAKHQYYMVDYNEGKVIPENIGFTAPLEGVKYYVTGMEFTIGVADSLTSVSGGLNSQFLSPMYWGMIQGYINYKFEALTNLNDAIIYHIGGYLAPYQNARRVKVNFDKPYLLNESNVLTIRADIFKMFKSAHEISIPKINKIHMPNDDSKLIADNVAQMFEFVTLK
jgi:hypothetical protein